jgi:iron-sulfur cluster insertion protein
MITLTANATEQIKEILLSEQAKYVRAFIEGGGCSGFNYKFTLEDVKNDEDFEISEYLIVDALSMQFFDNATIDYVVDKLRGSQFVITNPNAKSTCGCGSSFSI